MSKVHHPPLLTLAARWKVMLNRNLSNHLSFNVPLMQSPLKWVPRLRLHQPCQVINQILVRVKRLPRWQLHHLVLCINLCQCKRINNSHKYSKSRSSSSSHNSSSNMYHKLTHQLLIGLMHQHPNRVKVKAKWITNLLILIIHFFLRHRSPVQRPLH